MREQQQQRTGEGWAEVFRRAPAGVLALGALLGFVGGGMIVAGSYLAVSGEAGRWVVWGAALLLGPLILYVALSLVRLARWSWATMVALLALLLVSSAARALLAPDGALSAAAEVGAAAATLAYLWRPRVRRAFGR